MKKIIAGIMVFISFVGVNQVAMANPKDNGATFRKHTVKPSNKHEQKIDVDKLLQEDYKKSNRKASKVRTSRCKARKNKKNAHQTKEREVLPSDLLLSLSSETEEETIECQQLNLNEEIRKEIREENKKCQQTNLKASASLYKLLEADKPCEKNGKKYTLDGERTKGNAGSWPSSLDDILNFSTSEDLDLEPADNSNSEIKKIVPKTSKNIQQRNILTDKKSFKSASGTTSTDSDGFKAEVKNRAKLLESFKVKESKK